MPNEKKYKLVSKNDTYILEEEDILAWSNPNNLNLPASNEYMDSESDEFDEDIEYYESLINEDFLLREKHAIIADATDMKDDLLKKNAVAILMPYVRSEISLLTAQPDTDCVVLPPFNIAKLMHTNKN